MIIMKLFQSYNAGVLYPQKVLVRLGPGGIDDTFLSLAGPPTHTKMWLRCRPLSQPCCSAKVMLKSELLKL